MTRSGGWSERGIARGDLRPDADPELATELLVGPVYFRLMFGGPLDHDLAVRVVDNVVRGYGIDRPHKKPSRRGNVANGRC